MKKLSALILAAGFLLITNAPFSGAEEASGGLAVTSELDVVSKYVWRGIPLSETEAYQPSVTFSKDGFTANTWLNYRVDKPQQNRFSEIDLELTYKGKLKDLSFSPGFVLYTFSSLSPYGEAYLKLSCPAAFLKFITDHYFTAVGEGIAGGYYGDAGLGYERQLANDSLWTSSALLGWGNARFNSFSYLTPGLASSLNVLTLDTAISFKLGSNGSVRPHLTYHVTLPGKLRETLTSAGYTPNSLVIGVAAGYGF